MGIPLHSWHHVGIVYCRNKMITFRQRTADSVHWRPCHGPSSIKHLANLPPCRHGNQEGQRSTTQAQLQRAHHPPTLPLPPRVKLTPPNFLWDFISLHLRFCATHVFSPYIHTQVPLVCAFSIFPKKSINCAYSGHGLRLYVRSGRGLRLPVHLWERSPPRIRRGCLLVRQAKTSGLNGRGGQGPRWAAAGQRARAPPPGRCFICRARTPARQQLTVVRSPRRKQAREPSCWSVLIAITRNNQQWNTGTHKASTHIFEWVFVHYFLCFFYVLTVWHFLYSLYKNKQKVMIKNWEKGENYWGVIKKTNKYKGMYHALKKLSLAEMLFFMFRHETNIT